MIEARTVGRADAAVVAALHGECFPEDPWDETAVTEVLAMPGAFGFLLGPDGGRPDGFLLALDLGAECEVVALGVRPAARRRGHARRLMVSFIRVLGGRPAQLEVAEDNAPALTLYRSLGFRSVGRRPGYYRRSDGAAAALLLHLHLQKS